MSELVEIHIRQKDPMPGTARFDFCVHLALLGVGTSGGEKAQRGPGGDCYGRWNVHGLSQANPRGQLEIPP